MLPDRNCGSTLTYRPLSPSFQRPLQVGPRGVPTIGSVTYGYSALTDLVRNVSTELEPFARAVVAGSATTPLSAYGLLPEGMDTMEASPRVTPLKTALDGALQQNQSVLVEKVSLLSFFPEAGSGPTPTQATGISRLFERLGYGIEPNPTTMKTPFLTGGAYRSLSLRIRTGQLLRRARPLRAACVAQHLVVYRRGGWADPGIHWRIGVLPAGGYSQICSRSKSIDCTRMPPGSRSTLHRWRMPVAGSVHRTTGRSTKRRLSSHRWRTSMRP